MSFTFWGYLDQRWIDKKIEEYNLCSYEIVENLEDFGYEAKQLLSSPNPVIYCLIELIISQLIERVESNFELPQTQLETIRESLQDTIFVNALDSHLDASYVFEKLEGEILEDLKSNNGFEEIDEELETKSVNRVATEQATNELAKLRTLFSEYDF